MADQSDFVQLAKHAKDIFNTPGLKILGNSMTINALILMSNSQCGIGHQETKE